MAGIGAAGRYRDRRHAGQVLARHLTGRDWHRPLVLGLARGGVPVAAEVAAALGAPLRVAVARKIGAPGRAELALGAVTAHGPPTYDQRLLRAFHLDAAALEQECERERAEARSREARFGRSHGPSPAGRDVLLVDDGLATGATARAAIRMLRESEPRSIVLAVPVGAPDAVAALEGEADEVLCVLRPVDFSAVGQWYGGFRETTDEEILRLLADSGTGGQD
ncbi:phosphoribosyltransferase family protein [Saccharopolyspora gloriosae]|uniref:Putative phosphoribosyltransferase n=1 Tax=Saccharopolyspora gloriosae TaxID=455344 RepID=A0A840NBK9_9PSEU|nr:phosphoribosyltransferase family protein [Saccharopolyspora gloriosae]MBB5069666.1 putative phosphoribosyltransferase [Saccharopolyspora gloriosae]